MFASPLEVGRFLIRRSLFPWYSMNLVFDFFPTAPLEVGRCLDLVFVNQLTRGMVKLVTRRLLHQCRHGFDSGACCSVVIVVDVFVLTAPL